MCDQISEICIYVIELKKRSPQMEHKMREKNGIPLKKMGGPNGHLPSQRRYQHQFWSPMQCRVHIRSPPPQNGVNLRYFFF